MTMSIDNATPEEWYWAVKAVSEHNAMPNGADAPECVNCWLNFPFGEVKPFFRLMAFALWQQGHPIECRDEGEWHAVVLPAWTPGSVYRVLPKPEELVLPSIDWSHVASRWLWIAQDGNGRVWLYESKPKRADSGDYWVSRDGFHFPAEQFASLSFGRGASTNLIVQRPEGLAAWE